MSSSSLKRRLLIGGAFVLALLVGAGVFIASSAWNDVNRVTIDRPDPEEDSGGPVAQEDDNEPDSDDETDDQPSIEIPDDPGRQVILLVGSDTRDELDSTRGFGEFEGNRADVVMVLIRDGSKAGLLSIPRDLLVSNPCGGRDDRINAMLEGCEDVNGPTLLTLAVEETIGQTVDHFVLVEFEGFQHVVDVLGGYEICVSNPVRDERANLELPGGCTVADGEQTLAWMRSRRTQELTEDGWTTMAGMSDLSRNERQREFLIDMMGRMGDFSSPNAMAGAAQSLAPFVTVDSELSLMRAAGLAWAMRGIASGSVEELTVPVYDATTNDGANVLLPSEPIDEIVADFLATTAAGGKVVLGISE